MFLNFSHFILEETSIKLSWRALGCLPWSPKSEQLPFHWDSWPFCSYLALMTWCGSLLISYTALDATWGHKKRLLVADFPMLTLPKWPVNICWINVELKTSFSQAICAFLESFVESTKSQSDYYQLQNKSYFLGTLKGLILTFLQWSLGTHPLIPTLRLSQGSLFIVSVSFHTILTLSGPPPWMLISHICCISPESPELYSDHLHSRKEEKKKETR